MNNAKDILVRAISKDGAVNATAVSMRNGKVIPHLLQAR